MKFSKFNRLTLFKALTAMVATVVLGSSVSAQDLDQVRDQYPELASLLNSIDVTHASALETIIAINNDQSTQQERLELANHMNMMANMNDHAMHGGGGMEMPESIFGEMEVEARVALLEQLRTEHSDEQAGQAFLASDAIDQHTSVVLTRGSAFYKTLLAIYADDSVRNKPVAVREAVQEYLSDDRHSVAPLPKNIEYLLEHDQANALVMGYPLLRGFLWSNQWLELAALEALILEEIDPNSRDGVETVLERYWNKIGSPGGMSMFPTPTELPMVPAIAPNLYSQSPEAAYILDNLAVLKTMVSDIQGYPFVEDRQDLIDAAVVEFTNKEEYIAQPLDYLYFALRGGIYNQGGPATGDLMTSERNRSRAAMDMVHTSIMSVPQ